MSGASPWHGFSASMGMPFGSECLRATARSDGLLLRYEDPFDPLARIDEALRQSTRAL